MSKTLLSGKSLTKVNNKTLFKRKIKTEKNKKKAISKAERKQ